MGFLMNEASEGEQSDSGFKAVHCAQDEAERRGPCRAQKGKPATLARPSLGLGISARAPLVTWR